MFSGQALKIKLMKDGLTREKNSFNYVHVDESLPKKKKKKSPWKRQ
jgi:hypothetical protein